MPPRDTKRSRQRESKNATEQESCRGTGARRGLRRADAGTRLPIFERRARAEARGGRATEGRAHLGARRARAVGRRGAELAEARQRRGGWGNKKWPGGPDNAAY